MQNSERSELLEVDGEAVIDLTQRLVQTPSVFRPEDGLSENDAAELVAEEMRSLGWDPQIDEVAQGRPNVYAVLDGGLPGPTLMFEGHTDVVTEGDPSGWSHDPFGGVIEEGRLYGRGAADMKSGVAAMIHAAEAVRRTGTFPGRLLVAALVDEEGFMLGAKDFVARGHAENVDAAIICEPEGGEICVASKGAVRLRVQARGRMAHGAMPDRGLNPIPALVRLLEDARRLEQDLQAALGPHPQLGVPYITPTVLNAGKLPQLNVIPSNAEVAFDIRTVPGLDHPHVLARIDEIVREVTEGTGVQLESLVLEDRPWFEVSREEPVVRAVAQAHAAVTGHHPVFGGVPGATDGTILWRDAGIPVVVYGPGGKWIAHQVDEYVEVAELAQYADVYARAAISFLNAEASD